MLNSLIIADDFTGANDTGMQLRRRGYRTKVLFKRPDQMSENTSYVIDTESRGLVSEEAYKKVKDDITGMSFDDYKYVIKKVDSTLRGNVAEEIKAVDEVYESELVIFMPALPDLNRTTVHGIHMLNGVPITKTEIARDPRKPVTQDHIQKLLEAVYEEPVGHITIEDIEKGQVELNSGRVFAVDAASNYHMQTVIKQANQIGKRILFVGTAAIADNIFEIETPTVPAMGLIASVSQVTNEQIKYAADSGISLVLVSVPGLLQKKAAAEDYVKEAVELLKQKKDVLVLSSASYDRIELDRTIEVGAEQGMSREETSSWTQKVMGEIGRDILNAAELSGIFLTGGDTAMGFFEMAGANGSEIIGEIAAGIPIMRLLGGQLEGLKVVTKAGAFGNKDAINYALRKLKE